MRALLCLLLPAAGAIALSSHDAGAQYLSLGGGPTAAFGGLGGDRPTGVGVALSLDQERFERGLAWRGELLVSGFKAPEENAGDVGPIRNIGALVHAVYVLPNPEIEPYASVGIGPAWRGVGSPTRTSHWGALASLGAGFRVGPREKRVYFEGRVLSSAARAAGGGRPVQSWGLLLLGVNLGRDVGGKVE